MFVLRQTLASDPLDSIHLAEFFARATAEAFIRGHFAINHNTTPTDWVPTHEHTWENISADGRVRVIMTEVQEEP